MVTPVKRVPIHLQSAQNRILIKNGTVVNHDGEQQIDVYIEDTTVRMVGNHLIIPGGTRTIDATGKYIMPGGVDLNVHLQRPGYGTQTIDDFYQGTKAALAGGTTMIMDMVVPAPGETLIEAFAKWRKWADEKVCCDYALKLQLAGDTNLDQLEDLVTPEVGINTFQIDMAGEHKMTDKEIMAAMDKIAGLGGLAMLYAENGAIIQESEVKMTASGVEGPEGHAMSHPEEAQTEAVMRGCVLANAAECPLYVTSVMSGAAANIIKHRQEKGYVVSGEVTPSALVCDGSNYWNQSWVHSAAYVCTPPIREGEKENLLEAAGEGSLSVLASHHKPYNSKQKALGATCFKMIPKGVIGIEERLPLLWTNGVVTGKLTKSQFVSLVSTQPAKLINAFPQKGRIEVGADADLIIWDPEVSKTLGKQDGRLSKCDQSIYEGMEIKGGPEYVLVRGRLVKDQDIFRPMQGFGLYRELEPFNHDLYDRIRLQKESMPVRAVQRTPMDLPMTNGASSDEMPPPEPEDDDKPSDQQRSSVDLTSHPDTPDFETSRASSARSSVRVRAPPGGASSGFW